MTMLPRVRCAKCDKPVNSRLLEYDSDQAAMTLTVWCHGEKESMVLTDADKIALGQEGLDQMAAQEGIAFATARIAP